VVILHTVVDEALKREGLARELQSRLQAWRKEQKLPFEERIRSVVVRTASAELRAAVEAFGEDIRANVLIEELSSADPGGEAASAVSDEIEGQAVSFELTRAG